MSDLTLESLLEKLQPCATCDGKGHGEGTPYGHVCHDCYGTGWKEGTINIAEAFRLLALEVQALKEGR